MDTLNLEEVFVRINRFLNENCLDGSWNAKKDDVLEVVIIHRTCASRGSKQQHVVKIEREIHVDANGALEGLPVDGKDGSPSLHPLPPPYPLPLPLSIPLLPGAPLVNRKYEDRGAASQRQPWLECSVDDEVKVFGGNEATGAEEKADPSFNGAAKKLTTTTTKSVDDESAPRTKGRPLTFPELKRNEDGIIECPLCDETFEQTPRALNHYRKVHKKLVFPCEKCPREFYDIPSLKFHEDILHNDGKGELVCPQCGMRFHHASGIKYHVKRLHSDRDHIDDDDGGGGFGATKPKLKCSVVGCGETFDLHLDKQAHLFAAHHDEIKYCQVCKRPFTTEKYLFAHIKTTHIKTTLDNAPLHKCKYCDKAYALEESLSYHCDEEHEDEDVGPREFICPVSKCLKRFVSQANVDAHANVHKAWITRKENRLKATTKASSKPKSSSTNGSGGIDGGSAEDASEIEKSPCEVCGTLVGVTKMKRHVDSHRHVYKHKCSDCGRLFDRKDRLRNHRLVKHIKRELKCVYCHKIYYSRKVLTAHVKGVHEKVRHQCPMCERSYSQRPDLLVHIKGVHEGKRSLCSICGKEFIRASEKNRHERRVHNLHKGTTTDHHPMPTLPRSAQLPTLPLPLLPPPDLTSEELAEGL